MKADVLQGKELKQQRLVADPNCGRSVVKGDGQGTSLVVVERQGWDAKNIGTQMLETELVRRTTGMY